MESCDMCNVDLGGTCDHCGARVCEQCVRVCNECGDTCCSGCYDDEKDMCLTCVEEGQEHEEDDDE